MRKKKPFIVVLVIFVLTLCFKPNITYATENAPSRVINVVYDDSGSMIKTNGNLVDTWCQAKYSMEVFAAMLGENDFMNVYVMSDYEEGGTSAPPRLTLKGSSGAETNVKQVHQMLTHALNTPFNTVRKAYDDLKLAKADEKWLVILTDGAFEDGAFTNKQVEEYLGNKAEDINVMFLGMGKSAASIKSDEDKNIFFEKAQTNDQILNKITEICTRVFNSNKLEVDVSNGEFSFDIPMSEFVVFAQGDNVKLNGIIGPDGEKITYDKTPVQVKYSEKPSSEGYKDFIVDDKLNGSLATFTGEFSPGVYKVDVDSAKTVEVYYKPNVEIMLYLVGEEGQEVPYTDGIRAGEYAVKFGFVKAGSGETVETSKLLGDVQYCAKVDYNNGEDVQQCTNGDKINIQEGKYHIDAEASYLKYNSVETHIDFDVFKDKELNVELLDDPEYQVDKNGIVNSKEPMVFKVMLEGQEISEDVWADFSMPTFSQVRHKDNRVKFIVEKSDSPGIFNVYPELTTEKPVIGDYHNINYRFSVVNTANKSTWAGEAEGVYKSTDLRSFIIRHLDKAIKLIVFGGFLFIILGYVPGFKKYLPKKLKKLPTIECESKTGAHKQWKANGKFTKKTLSTFIPYRAERGTIRFIPRGVTGASSLGVKAVGSNKMEITNTKAYAGKESITFNGQAIEKNPKKKKIVTAGLRIGFETRDAIYNCFLNR